MNRIIKFGLLMGCCVVSAPQSDILHTAQELAGIVRVLAGELTGKQPAVTDVQHSPTELEMRVATLEGQLRQALAERDAIGEERDKALAERDAIGEERDKVLAAREASLVVHSQLPAQVDVTKPAVVSAYRMSIARETGTCIMVKPSQNSDQVELANLIIADAQMAKERFDIAAATSKKVDYNALSETCLALLQKLIKHHRAYYFHNCKDETNGIKCIINHLANVAWVIGRGTWYTIGVNHQVLFDIIIEYVTGEFLEKNPSEYFTRSFGQYKINQGMSGHALHALYRDGIITDAIQSHHSPNP